MSTFSNVNGKSRKSTIYILGLSIIIVVALFALILSHFIPQNKSSNSETTISVSDEVKGNRDATIASKITFRQIDFDMSMKQIQKMEDSMEDSLGDPEITESGDGFTYITYRNNSQKPLNYNGFTASSEGTACLTYVFKDKSLDETRLQFGLLNKGAFDDLLKNIRSQYGDDTYYHSANGTLTYWWKSSKEWLILSKDNVGVTLYFRNNK